MSDERVREWQRKTRQRLKGRLAESEVMEKHMHEGTEKFSEALNRLASAVTSSEDESLLPIFSEFSTVVADYTKVLKLTVASKMEDVEFMVRTVMEMLEATSKPYEFKDEKS